MGMRGLLFPKARTRALTFSFDDGVVQDRKLVALFNRYSLKGTFNINAGLFAPEGPPVEDNGTHRRMTALEAQTLYEGHEVAVHAFTHPRLQNLSRGEVIDEILRDRRALEALLSRPVRGMAYPFGTHTKAVQEALAACGIAYARTTGSEHHFRLPDNALAWDSTCHFFDPALAGLIDQFLSDDPPENSKHFLCGQPDTSLKLLYIWGHSYECDTTKPVEDAPVRWAATEDMCRKLSGHNSVWYATNMEIIDYLTAYDRLIWAVDGASCENPSAQAVYIATQSGPCVELPPGTTTLLPD